ncbi:MAG: ribonuclease P protein component [Pseudomonadota bacterium]
MKNEARKPGAATPPIASLKKRRDFLRLRNSKRSQSKNFTVQGGLSSDPKDTIRVGFTVTTKIGNAVVRNRIKRRLRQVANSVLPIKGLRGFDYVVIARRAALRAEFAEMTAQFASALDHIHKGSNPSPHRAGIADSEKDTGLT